MYFFFFFSSTANKRKKLDFFLSFKTKSLKNTAPQIQIETNTIHNTNTTHNTINLEIWKCRIFLCPIFLCPLFFIKNKSFYLSRSLFIFSEVFLSFPKSSYLFRKGFFRRIPFFLQCFFNKKMSYPFFFEKKKRVIQSYYDRSPL